MKFKAIDVFAVDDFAVTDAGYMVAQGNIARTGIQTYYAYELGIKDGDPNRKINLYRSPEEVFAVDSLASFENAPITIGHPKEWVNPQNWSQLAKGEAVEVKKVTDTHVGAKIVLKSEDAIKAVKTGTKELSNGYEFEIEWTKGAIVDGIEYDGLQRNIRGNHVAIVDKARCGSTCRIFDSEPKRPKGGNMSERKLVVDGIPVEVNETAAAAIEKLQKKVNDQLSEIQGLNQNVEKLTQDIKAVNDSHKLELDKLKEQIMAPEQRDVMVADWAALLAGAEKLAPSVVTKGKDCETVRREVLEVVMAANDERAIMVKAVIPDIKVADGAMLKAGFNVALAATKETQVNDRITKPTSGDIGRTILGTGDEGSEEVLMGRDAFLSKSASAWQGVKQ